jgi:hypothetical protein
MKNNSQKLELPSPTRTLQLAEMLVWLPTNATVMHYPPANAFLKSQIIVVWEDPLASWMAVTNYG